MMFIPPCVFFLHSRKERGNPPRSPSRSDRSSSLTLAVVSLLVAERQFVGDREDDIAAGILDGDGGRVVDSRLSCVCEFEVRGGSLYTVVTAGAAANQRVE